MEYMACVQNENFKVTICIKLYDSITKARFFF